MELDEFLPESARRFGNKLFTACIRTNKDSVLDFFSRPKDFLEQTIESLAPECKAAIALIFLNGGMVRSPVPMEDLEKPALYFGVDVMKFRSELEAMNGSLLNLVEDEEGPYWTYRHPTVSDSFASYVANSPELVEIYLGGAKPETIVREVVCSGQHLLGASVVVPNSIHNLLADRIGNLASYSLASFISYRSNSKFTKQLLELRTDLWKRLRNFSTPLKDDVDVDFLITLHQQQLLPEEYRKGFVKEVRDAVIYAADSSFLEYEDLANVLTEAEKCEILEESHNKVVNDIDRHIERVQHDWDTDYDPNECFDELMSSLKVFSGALFDDVNQNEIMANAKSKIDYLVSDMEEYYEPNQVSDEPLQQSVAKAGELNELFRDVDE